MYLILAGRNIRANTVRPPTGTLFAPVARFPPRLCKDLPSSASFVAKVPTESDPTRRVDFERRSRIVPSNSIRFDSTPTRFDSARIDSDKMQTENMFTPGLFAVPCTPPLPSFLASQEETKNLDEVFANLLIASHNYYLARGTRIGHVKRSIIIIGKYLRGNADLIEAERKTEGASGG